MRLVMFQVAKGQAVVERVGAMTDLGIVDLSAAYIFFLETEKGQRVSLEEVREVIPADMIRFMEGGAELKHVANLALGRVMDIGGTGKTVTTSRAERVVYRREEVKLLSPVPRPNSVRDTLSFEQHLKNSLARIGLEIPKAWYEIPSVYRGNHNSVIGTDDPILAPAYSQQLDYELEFGVFIGKKGKNIPQEKVEEYIYGYSIFNDVSARDVQGKEMSLMLGPAKSKNFDNGNVIGPCLTTADEIGDPYNLRMVARVNGEVWSEGNTGTMYWRFPALIEYISREETLYPGDFIASGTVGYGCGLELGKFLKVEDVVELEVEKIGVLRNRVVAASAG